MVFVPPTRRRALTCHLALTLGQCTARLRLVWDPDRRSSALAHGLGHALSHLERDLRPPVREVVLEAARAFSLLRDTPASSAEACLALEAAIQGAAPPALVSLRRAFPSTQVVPRWPSDLRLATDPRRPWPFDAEVAGVSLGRRRLIKRDQLGPPACRAQVEALAARGLRTRSVAEPGGTLVLFASSEEATLEAAVEAEQALRSPDGRTEAASWLGLALGYPRCCVDTFVGLTAQDDLTLYAELLPPVPGPPVSPLTSWLVGPLALLSHAPCSVSCAASLELAAALRDRLDQDRPGFAEAWTELAARVHVIDENGLALALRVRGDLADGARVEQAAEFAWEGEAGERPGAAPELEGRELRLDGVALVASGTPWTAWLVADHRG